MLRKTFKMLRKLLFNVANLVRATSNERSFHRCCEFMSVMLRAAGVATFSVSGDLPRGARAVFLPPGSRLTRGGEGGGAKVLSSPGGSMAHILQGIECPPSGEAFSDSTEHKVGRIVGRRSADPMKMHINTNLGSSSGYHGRPAATAPNTAGEVLPGSSAGQVGDPPPASPHTPPRPPSLFAFCILRCW
jgi:hypothetical protein